MMFLRLIIHGVFVKKSRKEIAKIDFFLTVFNSNRLRCEFGYFNAKRTLTFAVIIIFCVPNNAVGADDFSGIAVRATIS